VIAQLFSGLVEMSPEMEIVPGVARSWELMEGGRKHVFHLRDDVCWSDGAPVTAGDFEYAWKRWLDPATRAPMASLLYDVRGARSFHRGEAGREAVEVRATDDFTLVVKLEEPTAYFLHVLAWLFPVPRHAVGAHGMAWTEPGKIVGNGPFGLTAWRRGESMLLVRNPGYRGRFTGNVEQVELTLLTDPSGRLAMFEANDLDVLDMRYLTPGELHDTRQRHAGEYLAGPALTTWYMGFDLSRPPFDDVRVRRAFVLATDRDTLADVIMRGVHYPARGGFVPPGMPGHSAGIGLPYDPELAREYLAEAGYPGGRGFPRVELVDRPDFQGPKEYLQGQWQANLGVKIKGESKEWATLLDRMLTDPPHIFLMAWTAAYPDPDYFLRARIPQSYCRWQNEAFERLVEKARRVTDRGERMKLYELADSILVEEAAIVPLTYGRSHLLVKPWVSRYPRSALEVAFWKDVIIKPH
jgi:oligopeptide transport system substrate-binding protein